MYTYVYTEPAVNGIYRVEIEIRGACRTEEKRRKEKKREGRDLPSFFRIVATGARCPSPLLYFRRVKTIPSRVVKIINT